MGEANILLRTRGDRESGWACVVRCAELEAHLRRAWPTARVTVFAEGDHRTLDWLYARVRDLVGFRPGTSLDEEMGIRGTRYRADFVIFDLPTGPDAALREAWGRDADRVLVRSPHDSVAAIEASLHGVEPLEVEGRSADPVEEGADDVVVTAIADPGLA